MPLQTPTPLENAETINATRHIRSTHPHEVYHVGRHQHVATPHDKHSKLYHQELFNWHDLYDSSVSYGGNVVTRSQTAFNRINNGEPETSLFADKWRHHPPDLPHIVVTMKDGTYGALPRTIITRSMSTHLETNPTLCKTLEAYESFTPPKSHFDKKLAAKQQSHFFNSENGTSSTKVKIKQEDRDEIDGPLHSQDLEEASPSNYGPVRYIDKPKHWDNISSVGVKPQLLRESKFSQEVLDSLSHVKIPSLSTGFSKILKASSFIVPQNPVFVPLANTKELKSQSRGENQENQIPFPSVSSGGLKRAPSPNTRDFQQNKMKSPLQGKQAPSGMYS